MVLPAHESTLIHYWGERGKFYTGIGDLLDITTPMAPPGIYASGVNVTQNSG